MAYELSLPLADDLLQAQKEKHKSTAKSKDISFFMISSLGFYTDLSVGSY